MWSIQPEYPPDTRGNSCSKCASDLRAKPGTAGHERAVDTGIYIDFEGRIVFCESCLIEAAGLIGMVPAGAVEVQRRLVEKYRAEAIEAERTVIEIKEATGILVRNNVIHR